MSIDCSTCMERIYDQSSMLPTVTVPDIPVSKLKISYGGDYESIIQLLGECSEFCI